MKSKLIVIISLFFLSYFSFANDTQYIKTLELANDVSDEDYLDYRVKLRRVCFRNVSNEINLHSPPDASNDPGLILGWNFRYKNLYDMERAGFRNGSLSRVPWTGDYWPYYKGLLAHRYADINFSRYASWNALYNYSQSNSALSIYSSRNSALINTLSPAEKYDLLSGTSFPLTNKMWMLGRDYYVRYGTVEQWMGLCHGWAAASLMESHPRRSVNMLAFDNSTRITFYPDDIKAFLSYAWSNAQYSTKFAGRRCSASVPATDGNGRIVSPECNDLNPAAWHMVVVNQISAKREGFIMDSTYSHEVWNYPVYAYRYSYVNVRDRRMYGSLDQAKIAASSYTEDPYRRYRSPGTRYIVGINMQVSYVREAGAMQSHYDTLDSRAHVTGTYYYDLELDASGRIIGGEWRQQNRPDFVWKPDAKASPRSYFDNQVGGGLSTGRSLPPNWRNALNRASSSGYLVYPLVEFLVKSSK